MATTNSTFSRGSRRVTRTASSIATAGAKRPKTCNSGLSRAMIGAVKRSSTKNTAVVAASEINSVWAADQSEVARPRIATASVRGTSKCPTVARAPVVTGVCQRRAVYAALANIATAGRLNSSVRISCCSANSCHRLTARARELVRMSRPAISSPT